MTTTSTVFMFPGQGSQKVGMLDCYKTSPAIESTLKQASDISKINWDDIISNNPDECLNQTTYTQPALLITSVAIWRHSLQSGIEPPKVMAGHSLGELSALVCAEAISFDDGLRLVQKRAELMQQAVSTTDESQQGCMAAILGLDDKALIDLAKQISENTGVCEAVNFNAPGQVVIAGRRFAVEVMIEKAKELGAKRALMLPVSVAAHSSLMQPAADAFSKVLAEVEIQAPKIPVYHNVGLEPCMEPNGIKERLTKQLTSPVPWHQTINKISTNFNIDNWVECGPGQVLCGLNKRIDRKLASVSLAKPESLEQLLTC